MRKRLRCLPVGLVLFAVMGFVGYVAAGPCLLLCHLRDGVASRNAEVISSCVDPPKSWKKVKGELLRVTAAYTVSTGQDLRGSLTAGFASTAIDGSVDVFVTPDGIERIIAGEAMLFGKRASTSSANEGEPPPSAPRHKRGSSTASSPPGAATTTPSPGAVMSAGHFDVDLSLTASNHPRHRLATHPQQLAHQPRAHPNVLPRFSMRWNVRSVPAGRSVPNLTGLFQCKPLQREETGGSLLLGYLPGTDDGLRVPVTRNEVRSIRNALLTGTTGIGR